MTVAMHNTRVMIRLSQDQVAKVRQIARQRGCSLSDVLREAAIAYHELPIDEDSNADTHPATPSGNGREPAMRVS